MIKQGESLPSDSADTAPSTPEVGRMVVTERDAYGTPTERVEVADAASASHWSSDVWTRVR